MKIIKIIEMHNCKLKPEILYHAESISFVNDKNGSGYTLFVDNGKTEASYKVKYNNQSKELIRNCFKEDKAIKIFISDECTNNDFNVISINDIVVNCKI